MIRILFICHGNICRSAAAHMILQKMVLDAGLSDMFYIDSAATSTEEIGSTVYPPMKRVLQSMNIPILGHRARQVKSREYVDWDYIIGMDNANMRNLNRIFGGDSDHRLSMLMSWTGEDGREVEDPWYTGRHDAVAKQIERGCRAILDKLA